MNEYIELPLLTSVLPPYCPGNFWKTIQLSVFNLLISTLIKTLSLMNRKYIWKLALVFLSDRHCDSSFCTNPRCPHHSREYGSPANAPLSLSFAFQQPSPVTVGQHPQLLEMSPFSSPLPPGAALNQWLRLVEIEIFHLYWDFLHVFCTVLQRPEILSRDTLCQIVLNTVPLLDLFPLGPVLLLYHFFIGILFNK